MQNLKEKFNKIIWKIKELSVIKFLNDGGKPNIVKSFILILLFSVCMTVFQFILQGSNILQLKGPILFNFVAIFLIVCMLYFVIGKLSWTFSISIAAMSLLQAINHYKIKFRDEPLNPTDFSLGKEAGNIVKGYNLLPDLKIWCIIIICLFTVIFSFLFIKNKRPNLKISVIGTAITLVLTIGVYVGIYKNNRLYESFYLDKNMYHETEIVSSQGLVYSLINKTNVMSYEKPEGYSIETAEEILSRYPEPAVPENPPDVIAVMVEAYSDMQNWPNVNFTDENPYEEFNKIRENGCYGKIFVPFLGGGTAASEFEVLTGNNTSVISTAMPTAYSTHITKSSYSVAQYFKKLGYVTTSIHPGHAWFYNRQNVYPRLGFDTFLSKNNVPEGSAEVNYYIADEVTTDMIINDYKNHLETNPDKGYFNFTVTIQNHAPYNNSQLYFDKEYISKDAGLTDEEYYIINNYLGGVKTGNELIVKIYEYINTLDRPVVLLIFGDHLPYLDSEELIYEKLGLDIKSNTHEAYKNRYSTDYMIIGNNAYLEKNIPSISGQQGLISSNYLSLKMLQYMNIELPQFHAFLNDLIQYAPIVSRLYNGHEEKQDSVPPELVIMLKEYKILQYYNLRDYTKE